ncbi:MAG: 30S ribosomal protein S6e [Candidatus Woesearchaeota archaeon]
MAEFKLNINDPKTGKSYKKQTTDAESDVFRSKKLGEKVSGNSFGLSGYELEITGGSDNDGFPLRKDIEGVARKRPLFIKGVGGKTKDKGIKQRKTIRGNLIDEDVSQINLKIVKEGSKRIGEIFGGKEESSEERKQE